LSVRLVVDSYHDIFMPKAAHPQVRIEHVARMPGRAPETFAAEWGLSLHLDSEGGGERHQYLLDFGFTPEVLDRNFDLLGIEPEGLDGLILSHSHHDHYGEAAMGFGRTLCKTAESYHERSSAIAASGPFIRRGPLGPKRCIA
jgi:7,8-dihydropterin-6-yl-methyl-4-(beta-D-ribofuranosyl)aminobenzene 5'-phosphate synthase